MSNLEKRTDDGFILINKKVDDGFVTINNKIDLLSNAIAARNDIVDSRFTPKDDFEKRILELESQVKSNGSKSWVNNTLAAILGAILTGLVAAVVFLSTHRGV